jgi:hypothetical protein
MIDSADWVGEAVHQSGCFGMSGAGVAECRCVDRPGGFGVRTEAESRMRTVEECRESGTTGGTTVIEERERRPIR